MQQPERIPLRKLIYYGIGGFGWSLSINIITVYLLYFYLPPSNSGMKNLVSQTVYLGVFNIIAIILASGRLFDAVVDPLIAQFSDKTKNPLGRRIPLMRWAALPMSFFSVLLFFPPVHGESTSNVLWLCVVQLFYYFSFGLYVIPHNALIAELGHYEGGKMHVSTAQAVGFIIGAAFSSVTPMFADMFEHAMVITSRMQSLQYAIIVMNCIGAVSMALPAFAIDEKKYCSPAINDESIWQSLGKAFRNKNFLVFAITDCCYFMSIGIITTGLMYYTKSLLLQEESTGTILMGIMVVVTLIFYPIVNMAEKKFSKKRMMILCFVAMVGVFGNIFYLGKFPFSLFMQGVMLMVVFGIPDSFLGILPNTVIADIAQADAKRTGQNNEGMYFGMRALFQKFGQTMGIMIFAMLTLYGKDPGNDFGLRLSGVVGAVLCLSAALVYSQYKE
ncbi:MAG: MFS transporter [Bacteroidetes bacterium]|nr:MFS transporter [Bacteroidota bacterium]